MQRKYNSRKKGLFTDSVRESHILLKRHSEISNYEIMGKSKTKEEMIR